MKVKMKVKEIRYHETVRDLDECDFHKLQESKGQWLDDFIGDFTSSVTLQDGYYEDGEWEMLK